MKRLLLVGALMVGMVGMVGISEAGRRKSYDYGSGSNYQTESVDGYTRRDGTYVAPYQRTKANDTTDDNYGTSGNYNPWTGETGSRKSKSIWDND